MPLFDDDPFVRSKVSPTAAEVAIARSIWKHAGWKNPISIAEIIRQSEMPGLSARRVKQVVEQLRVTHHVPVGARREFPAGYFRIVDAEDLDRATRPYRSQILTMWRVLRGLMSKVELRELRGQLRLVGRE